MELFSDKLMKLKIPLLKLAIAFYLAVYAKLFFAILNGLAPGIKWHQGLFSFGSSTANGWFWSLTLFNLIIIVALVRRKMSHEK